MPERNETPEAGPSDNRKRKRDEEDDEDDIEEEEEHIKRPQNSFMLFRTAMSKQAKVPGVRIIQSDASKKYSDLWKALPADKRAYWERMAAIVKQRFDEEHPNYKYKPKSKAVKEKIREVKKKKAEEKKLAKKKKTTHTFQPPPHAYGTQFPYEAVAAQYGEENPSPPLSLASLPSPSSSPNGDGDTSETLGQAAASSHASGSGTMSRSPSFPPPFDFSPERPSPQSSRATSYSGTTPAPQAGPSSDRREIVWSIYDGLELEEPPLDGLDTEPSPAPLTFPATGFQTPITQEPSASSDAQEQVSIQLPDLPFPTNWTPDPEDPTMAAIEAMLSGTIDPHVFQLPPPQSGGELFTAPEDPSVLGTNTSAALLPDMDLESYNNFLASYLTAWRDEVGEATATGMASGSGVGGMVQPGEGADTGLQFETNPAFTPEADGGDLINSLFSLEGFNLPTMDEAMMAQQAGGSTNAARRNTSATGGHEVAPNAFATVGPDMSAFNGMFSDAQEVMHSSFSLGGIDPYAFNFTFTQLPTDQAQPQPHNQVQTQSQTQFQQPQTTFDQSTQSFMGFDFGSGRGVASGSQQQQPQFNPSMFLGQVPPALPPTFFSNNMAATSSSASSSSSTANTYIPPAGAANVGTRRVAASWPRATMPGPPPMMSLPPMSDFSGEGPGFPAMQAWGNTASN